MALEALEAAAGALIGPVPALASWRCTLRNDKQSLARIFVVAAGIVVATTLHDLTPTSLVLWHNLFQRLYYLPIVYAALYFGWRGGLLASTVSALCYIPHILMAWHHMRDYAMNQYAEIIVFFLVGTVTGVLADQGRKQLPEPFPDLTLRGIRSARWFRHLPEP